MLRNIIELSKYTNSPIHAAISKDWFYLFLQQCKKYRLFLEIEKESKENLTCTSDGDNFY